MDKSNKGKWLKENLGVVGFELRVWESGFKDIGAQGFRVCVLGICCSDRLQLMKNVSASHGRFLVPGAWSV